MSLPPKPEPTTPSEPAAEIPGLDADHVHHLVKESAIDPDVAIAAGVRSVEHPSDIPETIPSYRTPGILFAHTTVDDRVVWQYRPDDPGPDPKAPKYLFEKGSGSVISIHQEMRDRLAMRETDPSFPAPTRLVIVEGTKQYLAGVSAITRSPDLEDVIAVGIAGCDGWRRDGTIHPDIVHIVAEAETIDEAFIILDADRRTKRRVHMAGRDLYKALTDLLGLKAGYIDLAHGEKAGNTGLDDVLAALLWKMRPGAIGRLLDSVTFTHGAIPAKDTDDDDPILPPVPSVGDDADEDDEGALAAAIPMEIPVVVERSRAIVQRKKGGKNELLAPFAARITRRTVTVPTLTMVAEGLDVGDVTHDLEVMPQAMPGRTLPVRDVADADLARVRQWLARTPGGDGTAIGMASTPAVERSISEAIRVHRPGDVEVAYAAAMVGMQVHPDTGEIVYVHADGAITMAGTDTSVRARAKSTAAHISYPDDDPTTEEVRELVLGIREAVIDPTPVTLALGGLAFVVTGANAEAAIMLAGGGGSGKTALARIIMAAQGAGWAENEIPLVPASASPAYVLEGLRGFHNGMVTIDDVKIRSTHRATGQQATLVEESIRLSYDGTRRGRSIWGPNGATMEEHDGSRPLVLLTAEHLLDASAPGAETTAERLIGCTMTAEKSFHGGSGGESETYLRTTRLATEGVYNRAMSGYIRWLVTRANHVASEAGATGADGLRVWVDQIRQDRSEVSAAIATQVKVGKPRHAAVPAHIAVGWTRLAAWAREVGAITADEERDLLASVVDELVTAVDTYLTQALRSVDSTPIERILGTLRAAMASDPSIVLLSENRTAADLVDRPRVVVGQFKQRGKIVALNSNAVGQVIGMAGGAVTQALAPIAIRSASGQTSRSTVIGGQTGTRCVHIALHDWLTDDDDDMPTEAEAA